MEDLELRKELLDELMEYASRGMAREMRGRHGKPGHPEDMPAEPEAPPVDGEGAVMPEGGEVPPELLEKLKSLMGG